MSRHAAAWLLVEAITSFGRRRRRSKWLERLHALITGVEAGWRAHRIMDDDDDEDATGIRFLHRAS